MIALLVRSNPFRSNQTLRPIVRRHKMLSLPSLSSFVPSFRTSKPGPITLSPAETYDVEVKKDKASRTIKHLLKLNHANHAILFNNRRFHNHLPHHLGSAYLLNATPEHLEKVYDSDTSLVKWEDSPNEVSRHDWREYLGKKEYERAYVDFFEDELVDCGYEWKKVVQKYLFEGKNPLGNNLISGRKPFPHDFLQEANDTPLVCHPLIHLGYAVELNSKEVAMEALGLVAVSYNFMHKYLDDPSYTRPSPKATTDLFSLLEEVRNDSAFEFPGSDSIEKLFSEREKETLEYWNAWSLTDPVKQFENSQRTAAALLAATGSFDFFFVHTLTSSHAIRILLPTVPAEWHLPIVRQWWLITLAIYIMQQRPKIKLDDIHNFDLKGRDWAWAEKQGLERKHWNLDAHYVKAVRALKECAKVWGDSDKYFLKAAVMFAGEFKGWAFSHVESEDRYH